MKSLHENLQRGVQAILGEAGLLVRDGMTYSPIQFSYAQRVAAGFAREENPDDARTRINMLEAQTGTGKTLGYLVPLMLYAAYSGERVMVSTFTRMLQKQILEKDAQLARGWVKEFTGSDLSVHRRVGRQNYVSISGCEEMVDELEKTGARHDEAFDFLESLLDWALATNDDNQPLNSGVLDDFIHDMGFDELPRSIQRHRIMLLPSSPPDEQRQYLRDVATSKAADVIVVNHALLLTHALRFAQLLDDRSIDGRKTTVVVADEADRLEDTARSILGADLTLHNLNTTTRALAKQVDHPGAAAAVAAVQALYDFTKGMHVPDTNALAIMQGHKDSGALAERVIHAHNAVSSLARSLADGLQLDDAADDLEARFVDVANDLAMFTAALQSHDNTSVVSWSPVREYPSLRIGHPHPGRLLSRLWSVRETDESDLAGVILPEPECLKAVLFTSATLSIPAKTLPAAFDDFAQSVGVIRHAPRGEDRSIHRVQLDLYGSFEPRHFGEMRFVLADPRVPNPTVYVGDEVGDRLWQSQPEWLDYAEHMIHQAWSSGSRVLALTLSHSDTAELAARLNGKIPTDCLLVQRRGDSLAALRKQYVENDRALLLTPGGWEGLDLPRMVQNLVITRIPFAPMNGSDSEILRAHLVAKGMAKDKINAVISHRIVNAARRKLAQGIGRAIRTPSDKSTVWIADPRFPMPEAMARSLDPIILEAPQRRIQHMMLNCIPARFLNDTFEQAQLCLMDAGLHRPI